MMEQNDLAAPEVDVGQGEIADALVVAAMVVVPDEGRELAFGIARRPCPTGSAPPPLAPPSLSHAPGFLGDASQCAPCVR